MRRASASQAPARIEAFAEEFCRAVQHSRKNSPARGILGAGLWGRGGLSFAFPVAIRNTKHLTKRVPLYAASSKTSSVIDFVS